MRNEQLDKKIQIELLGETVKIVENQQIQIKKGKSFQKQTSDVKRRWCPLFMNSFAKYLKKEGKEQDKLLESMKQIKGGKQKYEQKELKQLLNTNTSHFKDVWLNFLDSPFLQESIRSNNKIKNEDTKEEYLKLIPEIIGETKSQLPFTNFLAATYIYEINQEIITSKSVERNNEQGEPNLVNQSNIENISHNDSFI